jgi:hypothetical protein
MPLKRTNYVGQKLWKISIESSKQFHELIYQEEKNRTVSRYQEEKNRTVSRYRKKLLNEIRKYFAV